MSEQGYFSKLAERALDAWGGDQAGLRDAVAGLLSETRKPQSEVVADQIKTMSRDDLQEALTAALVLPNNFQNQPFNQRIETIALYAARINSIPNTEWQTEVGRLFKRHAVPEAHGFTTKADWQSFLQPDQPSEKSTFRDSKPAGDAPLPRRFSTRMQEAADLIGSYAPVLSRRVAADLTRRHRVRDIFDTYGYAPSGKPADELALLSACLEGTRSPDKLDQSKFKNWPSAAVAGSFASDLAAALDYPPSAWVLGRELKWIDNARSARNTGGDSAAGPPNADPPMAHPRDLAWKRELLGVAFSGGGIRSATFNLGVLQGIAKLGMLQCVDLLSTVSGGGYIGSWLINWIRRSKGPNEVENDLDPTHSPDPAEPRLRPIQFLRDFSNYLTPRLGLLSADTWVVVVVWARNTLLNLLVLLPALFSLVMLPRTLQVWATAWSLGRRTHWYSLGALLLIVIGVAVLVALNMREFRCTRSTSPPKLQGPPSFARPWWIRGLIVVPLFAAAWLAALEIWRIACDNDHWEWIRISWIAALCAVLMLLIADYLSCFEKTRERNGSASLMGIAALIIISAALGCVAAFIAMGLGGVFQYWPHTAEGAAAVTSWGVPLVLLGLFLEVVLLVGLMGRNLQDGGAKWISRLRAQIAMYSTIWAFWVGLSIYGANLDRTLWYAGHRWAKWPVIGAWLWTTARSVMAGNDPSTGAAKPGDWKTSLGFYATVGPYVFIAGLFLALSFAAENAFHALASWLGSGEHGLSGCPLLHAVLHPIGSHPYIWAACLGSAVPVGLAALLSYTVDVNEFSMNRFYRNRLVRCYLGAANENRRPNPFTGFDLEDDSYPLAAFKNLQGANGYKGPYPLYNATLNLVHGEELAWQERKGASFVFTPDMCGYETPWNAATNPKAFQKLQYTGYRETSDYAYPPRGMHLGTPTAVSGAAASPNMGSYSRAATAFLMTVFNVRLGWWLGNPRHIKTWQKASPTQGLAYLVKELLGLTDDRSGFVYLSDGGHFENLAIYELVRRRCRYIIACDAEEDHAFNFQGLGNAIRKCRDDFGVEIKLQVSRIKPDPASNLSRTHCVVGTIQYPDQPLPGHLVYMKASLVGDEPQDVIEYHAAHESFPHQSTANQWFTESQFESYRRLGMHIATMAFDRAIAHYPQMCDHKRDFFQEMFDYWYPPSDAIEKNFTNHAAAFDALIHEMRSDPELRILDAVIYPTAGMTSPTRLRDTTTPEKSFLFFVSLVQLMENVYLDLDLENTANHPHNAGWIHIFETWAQTEIFKEAWHRCAWTYGSNFRCFCNRRFGLPSNP